MGLDIALGVIILLGAVRGWFRGFLLQAIRLGGLVGAVYLGAPVRELARPYVAPHLTSIRADLLDRMLWWGAVVACYLVVVGLLSMVVHMQRRRPYGDPESSRVDQLAGFLLAGAKAALVLAFGLASLDKYVGDWARSVPWADEQARTSTALGWERQYHPADRVWAAPPVQQFVAYVRRMGMGAADAPGLGEAATKVLADQVVPRLVPAPASDPEATPTPTASAAAPGRNPRLGLLPPRGPRSFPPADATDAEVAAQIRRAAEAINPP